MLLYQTQLNCSSQTTVAEPFEVAFALSVLPLGSGVNLHHAVYAHPSFVLKYGHLIAVASSNGSHRIETFILPRQNRSCAVLCAGSCAKAQHGGKPKWSIEDIHPPPAHTSPCSFGARPQAGRQARLKLVATLYKIRSVPQHFQCISRTTQAPMFTSMPAMRRSNWSDFFRQAM